MEPRFPKHKPETELSRLVKISKELLDRYRAGDVAQPEPKSKKQLKKEEQ